MRTPLSILKELFQFIEENLQSRLTLDSLSKKSGLNAFQLIRLFDQVVGLTPMAYVRARKLARSMPQVLRGDPILTIALDWGFQYEQSYIRAFQSEYGVTPARFRRNTGAVTLTGVPNLDRFTLSASGMIGEPVLRVKSAHVICGALKRYSYQQNLLLGTPLLDGITQSGLPAFSAASRESPRSRFEHLYLILTGANDPGAEQWTYPAGQWAHFEYIGLHGLDASGVQRIRLLMQLVIGGWFAAHQLHWNYNFLETVDLRNCAENYCELSFSCFVTEFSDAGL